MTDRPLLAERQLVFYIVIVNDGYNYIIDLIFSVGSNALHYARKIGAHKAAVFDDGGFRAGGVNHAAGEPVARLDGDGDVPFAFRIKGGHACAAVDEGAAGMPFDFLERALDTVEDIVEDTGAEGR